MSRGYPGFYTLTYDDTEGRYILELKPADRWMAKGVGFRWDKEKRYWYTRDVAIAAEAVTQFTINASDALQAQIDNAMASDPIVEYEEIEERWICKCRPDQREIPKSAGFEWDPVERVWHTTHRDVAYQLAQYMWGDALNEHEEIRSIFKEED